MCIYILYETGDANTPISGPSLYHFSGLGQMAGVRISCPGSFHRNTF